MADTDPARIGDVKAGLAAAKADTATRAKKTELSAAVEPLAARDGSNVEADAFRGAIGAQRLVFVAPEDFGAVADGVADDSAPMQAAIDYLEASGGGTLILKNKYLAGGLEVTARHIVFQGTCRGAELIVKNGTLGVHIKADWVHFRHLNITSQGEREDGLNTRGVLYSKGVGFSTGHVFNYDLNVQGFSGFGIEHRNALDILYQSTFFRDCKTGLKFRREGSGAADFSTTIQLVMVYGIACDVGVDVERVRHSKFSSVMCEWNRVGIVANVSDFELEKCYFENNTEAGIQCNNSFVTETDCYYNSAQDSLLRAWTPGVVAAPDRFYRSDYKGDTITKRLGLLGRFGVSPAFFSAVGDTTNIGVQYGGGFLPRVYSRDILNQRAWTSWTTSELIGWDVSSSAYKIATALTGPRGMKQSVNLDASKTYVIDASFRNVTGAPLGLYVDGIARTTGVPFTVATTGSKVVGCWGNQTADSENYVISLRLMEVSNDPDVISRATDTLSRASSQRDQMYSPAPPASGPWAVGEVVWNSSPTIGSPLGWVCTASGIPGTWTSFGSVGMTRGASQANTAASDVAGLVADFNALLAKLRAANILTT